MFGYNGVIALIDLDRKVSENIKLDEGIARKFIGGTGIGTYLLMNYSSKDIGPLSPENPLIYMTGPFTATGVPTSGRHHIVSKSPLTGIYCESDAGGTFGTKLKRSGYDGLIIIGKAESPLYIAIDNGEISFKNADAVWGLDTFETVEVLTENESNDIAVSCIGKAGENLVSIAGIFHDGYAARAAARGGLGAVMGSKNLKAITVRGTGQVCIYDKEKLFSAIKLKAEMLRQAGAGMTNFGTAGGMETAEKFGDLPIKNWQMGSWAEEVKLITGKKMKETILHKEYGCVSCPIRCGRIVKFDEIYGSGPEYETMATLGSLCLVDDLKAISRAADNCNRYGIDTISAGGIIAFAMELYEKGIITKEYAGREINWGDSETVIKLIEEISLNKGFGKILGNGVRKAAEQIGNGAEKYAIHAKGMEFPAHDPRCYKGLAVGYATSSRGACHLSSFTYPWERAASMPELGYDEPQDRSSDMGKGKMTAQFQDIMSMADSLKLCKFALSTGAVKISDIIGFLNSITNWGMTFDEFMTTGTRINTLKRVYNNSLGLDRKDDNLPERILKQERGTGGSAHSIPNLQLQLDEYYAYRGWNENGMPKLENIHKFGLGEFLDNYDIN